MQPRSVFSPDEVQASGCTVYRRRELMQTRTLQADRLGVPLSRDRGVGCRRRRGCVRVTASRRVETRVRSSGDRTAEMTEVPMTTHHVTTTDGDVPKTNRVRSSSSSASLANRHRDRFVEMHCRPGVQNALDEALADQPGRRAVVLAFRTLLDGVETTRMGPEAELPPDDELIVVSVVTSEVSTTAVHVVAHTVVAHVVAD